MTRKRFIKQLMSFGVSRNEAVRAAREVDRAGSYFKLWVEYVAATINWEWLQKTLSEALDALAVDFEVTAQYVGEIYDRYCQTR